jgi:DinB superfamily
VVSIHPPLIGYLSASRADELVASGLFADDLPGIRAAHHRLGDQWDATGERAKRLGSSRVEERVGGEWSFIETLRHLVMVTDVWVGDVIEEVPSPYHPWGMPPDFLPPDAVSAMGLTVDARPTLDEVCALRDERRSQVERVLAGLAPEGLDRTCAPRDGQFQVVGALQVVLFETWAHHQYAARDLAVLEQSTE